MLVVEEDVACVPLVNVVRARAAVNYVVTSLAVDGVVVGAPFTSPAVPLAEPPASTRSSPLARMSSALAEPVIRRERVRGFSEVQ